MTHVRLDGEIALLEKKRKDLFDKLADYDANLLNKKPAPDEWSVIQVLDHLITVERAALYYVRKKSQDMTSVNKTGIKEWFRSFLLNRYLRKSKKKFPAPPSVIPTITYASLDEMSKQWNAVRHEIKETIAAIPSDKLDHNWFKHPAIGKINLLQMLTFIDAHYGRHEKQIWNTIKKVS